jgi:hypothetical protein
MESELLKKFLAEQPMLMEAKNHIKTANKTVIRPGKNKRDIELEPEEDYEEYYNYILQKKPPKKKVIKFLQVCINTMLDDDDE